MTYGRMAGLIVALAALTAPDAGAQWNVARFGERSNIVYGSYALDPALVAGAGYGRVVRIFGHPFQWTIDGGIGVARPDWDDFHGRIAVQSALVRWESLALTGNLAFVTRGTQNTVYLVFNVGSEMSGTAGVYRKGWFLAGELGFDKAIITHVTHTDWYRQYYYPDVKDGWYLNAGGVVNYGFVAGLTTGRAEWNLRAGWLKTQEWDNMVPPQYASLGVGVGF